MNINKILLPTLLVFSVGYSANTQNAGTVVRDTEFNIKQQLTPKLQAPKPVIKEEDPLDLPDATKVFVKRFEIFGSTLFDDSVLQKLIQGYSQKELTFLQLKKVIKILSTFYRENGYLAKIYFPEQDISKGNVVIRVIEGKLGSISIDSQSGLDTDFTKKFVSSYQNSGKPIYLDRLDRSVLILSDIPGVIASSSLSQGAQKEQTNITVSTKDTQFFNFLGSINNTGSRSTGRNQTNVSMSLNNISGYGDQVQLTAVKTKGNEYFYGEYSFQILYDGLRGAVFASNVDYELINSYASSESEGTAHNYGFKLNYPLLRTTSKNINVYAKYENKLLRDYALQASTAAKKTEYINIGISSFFQDSVWGLANNQFSLELTQGYLDRKSNNDDFTTDQSTAKTNGSFSKMNISINRVQQLTNNYSLRLKSNIQYANQNLDSSEKMGLGGAYSVRAYPSSEANGDQALLLQLEVAKSIKKNLEMMVFYDYGWVRSNKDLWSNWDSGSNIKNVYSLDGIGIGLNYQLLSGLSFDITMSHALKNNRGVENDSTNSDGSKRSNRFWMNLTYQF